MSHWIARCSHCRGWLDEDDPCLPPGADPDGRWCRTCYHEHYVPERIIDLDAVSCRGCDATGIVDTGPMRHHWRYCVICKGKALIEPGDCAWCGFPVPTSGRVQLHIGSRLDGDYHIECYTQRLDYERMPKVVAAAASASPDGPADAA